MIPMEAHGTIALQPSSCTSCMICVRECPSWCIELESHTEQSSEPGARRPKTVNVLDAFRIDFGLCMYCGICVDLCPFDALAWSPAHAPSATTAAGLVLGIEELAEAWPESKTSTGS
ncbi:MAG: 4Fe-4S dicluster domain-containing protein [Actinobacteria bacterium]|nr:4Fe-4S dicluster domain-containing protein [Actinomycetota bacterium]